MTIRELKEKLEQFDDNLIVMLADDTSEWGYFPLRNVSQGVNEFDGAIFLDNYIEEECATCMYYNTDRKDQPCCSCIDWGNWEKDVN